MQSRLNVSEFRNKLERSTEIGHPALKLLNPLHSLFSNRSKPYFGLFDQENFNLTSNSKFGQSLFNIKGKYNSLNGELKITYSVLPKFKYQYHFWALCVIYGFGMILYLNLTNTNKSNAENLTFINVFSSLLFAIGFISIIRIKKKFEKNFVEFFELV